MELERIRKAGGAGIYHDRAMMDRAVVEASPFYQDVCAPNRIQYTTGISVPWNGEEAAICVSFTSAAAPGYDPAAGALLRLLIPAFESGLAHWAHRARRQGRLRRMIDALAAPVLLFDADGEALHRNRALRTLLDAEPAADRVLRAAARLAAEVRPGTMARGTVPEHHVDGGETTYRLHACIVRPDASGPPAVLVTVTRLSLFPPAPVLEQTFDLTPREAEVALLVARGTSNADLAARLHISPHTARHHVASVMKKLDVSSRARVTVVLLGGSDG